MKVKQFLLMLSFLAASQFVFGQITGSKHDFSTATWNTSGEICIVCHISHGAQPVANAPLWNHATTQATFTVYSSPTLNAGTPSGTIGQPSASSKLCLSCHDNTVVVGGGQTISQINPSSNVSTDLSNDHPISFTYDDVLANLDGGLYTPSTHPSGIGSGTIASSMLFDGKMECASCHDVHNAANLPYLLVKSNAGSALCLTCHSK